MSEPMAPPPPPPFPPAPAPQKNNTMKWVLGCGLGCLVFVIVAVVAVSAAGYFAFKKGVPAAVNQVYSQLKTEGKVPAEDQPAFDRIVELGTSENASWYASTLVLTLVGGTLADGAINDDERTAVNDALTMLEANPDISATQFGEFQQKHPGLATMQPGVMGMPAPAPEPEPPAVPEATEPPATAPEPAPETLPAPETAPETPPAEGAAPPQ